MYSYKMKIKIILTSRHSALASRIFGLEIKMNLINIKGARVHNLKDFDISIPKNTITVATGVSGSGKSSLMFDIIFEEGRKQYLQSLGIFPGLEDERKFDSISGISPTIAVKQSIVRQNNSRSTVGSRTRLLNQLAMLYHSEGKTICPNCRTLLGKNLVCGSCGYKEHRLDVSFFSYNTPNGMCKKCLGKGTYYKVNMDKLITSKKITVRQIFKNVGTTRGIERVLNRNLNEYMDLPYLEVPDEVKIEIENGHYTTNNGANNQSYCLSRILQARKKKGEFVGDLYQPVSCSECNGYRIGEKAKNVLINGKHIGELGKMTLDEATNFLETTLQEVEFTQLGKNLMSDIINKLRSLINYRLGHLTMYREMSTLSGGEIQRIFLNEHLESEMDSLIYILDEPTAGLHELEKEELLKSIKKLKDLGNTIIIVEHDKKTIQIAEHIVDIGPKAGIAGGEVIYEGDYAGLLQCENSLTGQYLSYKQKILERSLKPNLLTDKRTSWLSIHHAKTNNLKDVTVSFPLRVLVGVAGVSGSGKSSLVSDTLVPILKNYFRNSGKNILDCDENESDEDPALIETIAEKVLGVENLSGLAEVSQAPIGRNINSSPVIYIKIWDKIRNLFAQQEKSKKLGLTAGHFSFNSDGACPDCGGSGRKSIFPGGNIKMYTTCETCKGLRYNEKSLQVTYRGKNISEILDLQISEAVKLFNDNKPIVHTLKIMEHIGMGYIKLGQPTSTLSGGEAQRLKLAKEIGKKRKGNILYVLDEPTTGLSMYDTAQLIKLLNQLVEDGNSVLVIEHNLDILKSCDWIVELGPDGGINGGTVIAEGSPEDIIMNQNSKTGRFL